MFSDVKRSRISLFINYEGKTVNQWKLHRISVIVWNEKPKLYSSSFPNTVYNTMYKYKYIHVKYLFEYT